MSTLSAALALLVTARDARSADRQKAITEVLDVRAGATCIETSALAEQVAAWLDAGTTDADVWVRVAGSPDDPRTVSFEMGRGDRVLAHRRFAPGPERCDHLEATVGLAIALAIRASLLDEIVGPQARPAAPAAREPWGIAGGAMAAYGVLPGVALGAGVRVERTLPPNFALRLGVFGLAVWDRTFDTVPGSFDAELLGVRADACVRFDVSAGVAARGCAGLMAGDLLAQGRDFASSRSASSAWLGAAEAAGVAIGLADHWFLDAEATLVVPLGDTRAGIVSTTGDVVEARDLSATGVTMTLGPVYRF